MSAGLEHSSIISCFLSSLSYLMSSRNIPSYRVSFEQFFLASPHRLNDQVSPDVYLTIPAPADPLAKFFRTWELGNPVPAFVLEVISDESITKDYNTNPTLYDRLGVQEYCILDADVAAIRLLPRKRPSGIKRSGITLFRRQPGHRFTSPVYQGPGPVYSATLGVWLRTVQLGQEIRLRMSFDEQGEQLVPTHDEARVIESVEKENALALVISERAEKEREREAKEAAVANEKREREAKEAALKELAELKAKFGLLLFAVYYENWPNVLNVQSQPKSIVKPSRLFLNTIPIRFAAANGALSQSIVTYFAKNHPCPKCSSSNVVLGASGPSTLI